MSHSFLFRCLLILVPLALISPSLALTQDHPANLISLVNDFREWRAIQRDEISNLVETVGKQRESITEFRRRLDTIDVTHWPVHARVDLLVILIEMNALEFDLNVVRQISRNPDFYLTHATSRVTQHIGRRYQVGPGVTVPYDDERARSIVAALEETSVIVEQAPAALKEAVPEMADMAVAKLEGIRSSYSEFARVVAPHLPQSYRLQLNVAAEKAGRALEDYGRWIEENRAGMTAPYAIGREAFDWYVQNVLALPFDSEDLLMQAEMERHRNWSFLQFERQKNRHLPGNFGERKLPGRLARTNEEYSEWKDATDVLSRIWAEELELFTHPEELGPMRSEEGGVWIEPFGMMAFPDEPKPEGTKTEYLVSPEHWFSQIYWEIGHRLDPGTNHPHSDYPGHTFEGVVSRKTTCEVRRGHRLRGDAWTNYMEEIQLQTEYPYVRGARVREWMYGLAIMRAERIHIAVLMADGTMRPSDVAQHMMLTVPWMEPHVATKHEVWRKFSAPGQVLSYQVNKFEVFKLLRDRMMQLGEDFDLRTFHDALLATGRIPVSLARWELAGIDKDVRHLWEKRPVPE